MREMMVIRGDAGRHTMYRCASCPPMLLSDGNKEADDKLIPTFYSARHAHDSGWRSTSAGWICPKCAGEEQS